MENIKDQAIEIIKITEGNICDRCLGRNFYPKISGKDNRERGHKLKIALSTEEDLPENNKLRC